MRSSFRRPPLLIAALAALTACASNGDPPTSAPASSDTPAADTPAAAPAAAASPAASIDARDVAVLVLEQTPASLRVTSAARRPRSSFGPADAWNGAGTPTHRWTLLGPHGETLASGDIVARSALEAPPSPTKGQPPAHVPRDSFSFVAKVPQPAPGEAIQIAPTAGSTLVARWP